ncbi:response regulator [Haloarcula nitratireducens]|uniref:Response regulator n=1 Tax=Haloarcula nitratireducens TaxID=2487749 RepID=A0AAW4P840_9EURY|nr:response regulator [Halomicroarcula nitratireducens]MBX0293928.1 response regulator [Halomicroarcula nitratireducens]
MVETVGTVLVVDDESDCRALYRIWLREAFDVMTAKDGVEALDQFDETVDVVILDREMSRKDGTEVATELAARDADAFVAMVSGVEPGTDLLEIPVDEYLQKPVGREDVLGLVDRAMALGQYRDRFRRFCSLAARVATVEQRVHRTELDGDATYREAVARLERERRTVEAASLPGDAVDELLPSSGDAPTAQESL